MKKKIALFANGWTGENLVHFTNGFVNNLPKEYADTYMFICYNSYGMDEIARKAERMVYKLPQLDAFDAAVIFGPGLNFREDIDAVYSAVDEAGIPAVSIGMVHEGHINICVDNRPGMYELCNHVIEEHKAKRIAYFAGSRENEDSNERLEIIKECMEDHGLKLDDSDVYYTNWEISNSREAVLSLVADPKGMPDAIICANDPLAIHAILTLNEKGYKVPEDIPVTGFDNLTEGQDFYPTLTSVDQPYDEAGERAAEYVKMLLDGDRPSEENYVDSRFVIKESCGCHVYDGDGIRREFAKNRPYAKQKNYGISGRLLSLEQAILKSQSYHELEANLASIFYNSDGSEGGTFYLMLDPIFENIGKDIMLPAYTYCDEFNITTGKCNSIPTSVKKVSRTLLIPGNDESEENHLYGFLALYYESFICGYMVFGSPLDKIVDNDLFLFNNRINIVLMFLKRNMQLRELNDKLSELMDQDALTRVKNRTAYDKYLRNLEAEFIEGENKPFAVIYFDINNLKAVNDMYGHEKGDAYIKNSCRLICNTFKHSPVFRIGGDEFVSIAQNDDYEKRHELLEGMREHMKALKIKGDSVPLTERISIASGMAEYDRTLDDDFASIFKRADELMYENKYNMKNPGR